jgi:hypothetical protein
MDSTPLELVVIRVRNHGRTYWLVADAAQTRAYPPHVSERVAIARFSAETGREYLRVTTFRQQHTPAAAAQKIKRSVSA